MGIGGSQADAHRDNRNMSAARLAPTIHFPPEVADTATRKDHILPTEFFDRPL